MAHAFGLGNLALPPVLTLGGGITLAIWSLGTEMTIFNHILFPVDFSPRNCGIAPSVRCMANRYRARVTLLYVTETASPIDQTAHHLEAFLKNDFEGVATTRLVLEGDPAGVIIDYAEKQGVDLVMLPTHGYGPFRRLLLGSVTTKVLHDASCAVWTSAHAPEAPPSQAGYRNILCAVDLTAETPQLIQWASGFARDYGARLNLVHAVPAAEARAGFDFEGPRFRTQLLDAAREELARVQKEAGTSLVSLVEAGGIAPVICRAAEENHADLIVTGRGVMQQPFGRMLTHVYSIICGAPSPVISVPESLATVGIAEVCYA